MRWRSLRLIDATPSTSVLGDRREGHRIAFARADPHLLEVAETVPVLGRVAHHHRHIGAAALQALGLCTVEGLAHLAPEILVGQPEHLGGGLELDLDLLLAAAERVGDVEHPGIARECTPERVGRLAQRFEILAPELDRER